jgi:hypothetical protein
MCCETTRHTELHIIFLAKQVMEKMSKYSSQNISSMCRASQSNTVQVLVNYDACGPVFDKKKARQTRTNDKKLGIDAHGEARKSNYVSRLFQIGQEYSRLQQKRAGDDHKNDICRSVFSLQTAARNRYCGWLQDFLTSD